MKQPHQDPLDAAPVCFLFRLRCALLCCDDVITFAGRLTYNVSYTTGPDSIEDLYTRVQAHGIATLSYMNVFEFGMNVRGHATGAAVAAKPDDYRNATLYAQNQLSCVSPRIRYQFLVFHRESEREH